VGFSGNAQKCISEKKVIASEATYTSKWGKTVYMQYFLIPIFVQNNIVGVWANLHNLTDLWNTKNDLIIAKEKAEESDKLKSAFLQNISHEVRTPLNSIVGFSQLITKKNQTPEKVQLYSDLIYSNSYKLIGIISDVIEISQIQSKQIHANYSMFDIILFIKSQFSEFINIVNEKNLRYNLTIEPNIEKYIIKSDEEKLRKIIYHIIDNSIKFTSKGKVDLSIKINEEKIVIAISDTGIGISDEMKKIIFMPFRQAETGVIRNFGGNGLGLALAKSYIELLSGKIDLQSEINVGTTITLHLPVKEEKNDFYKNQKNYNKKNINTILIAEDEFSNYLLLIELMNSSELKILHALNGQQAVDFCRNGNDIDLILMDIKMPIMDGQEAAKVIKEFRPDIPIIAQSAYFEETEIEKYKDIFDDCIEKPINEKVLKEILEKYFLYSDKIKF
jgi:signal transduction histidine kinase